MNNRPDDPLAVMSHKDRFFGGKALIVLGGPSGAGWQELRYQLNPDVILTANGNTDLPGAEYWMLAENMNYQYNQAKAGDERGRQFVQMLNRPNTARFRLVSHRSWNLLDDHTNCIRIRRKGYKLSEIPPWFSFRNYDDGYLWGWMMKHTEALQRNVRTHVGTVGLHLLHHAGILGCAEIHTIGFDLMFRGNSHHWYQHPKYQPDRFSTEHMFITRRYGDETVRTRWDMLEAAQYLKAIEARGYFERDNIAWTDHSDGLLKREGLTCAA